MKLPSPVPSSGALRPQHRSASRIGAAPQPHEGGRRRRILVLKLGALGNMVLSLSSFAAIRRRHPDASITLLTTAPYAAWMAESPWFDRVLIDSRPAWWDLSGILRLRHMLLDGRFDRVYDLQTSSRSSPLFPPVPAPRRALNGRASPPAVPTPTAASTATWCMTSTASTPSCARPALPTSLRLTCRGPTATSLAWSCPHASRCWCPAAPRTVRSSAGPPRTTERWPTGCPPRASSPSSSAPPASMPWRTPSVPAARRATLPDRPASAISPTWPEPRSARSATTPGRCT